MSSSELDILVMDEVRKLSIHPLMEHFNLVAEGQREEILDRTGRPNLYYQWLYCLMKVIKPKMVVELGAAAGISTEMMASALPDSALLVSVDNDPIAWRWMDKEFPNIVKVLGDDLDLKIYPNVIEKQLKNTDVWFIDSLHTQDQLQKEVDLYKEFWKSGTIVLFDDIDINEGMRKVWDSLEGDKFENKLLHWSGFGILTV